MNKLTEKEIIFVELIASGMNQTNACLQAFDCKDKKSASVLATNIMKKPKISKALARREEAIQDIRVNESLRFVEQVEKYIGGKSAIAKRLADVIKTGGKRDFLEGLKQYLLLTGDYAAAKSMSVIYGIEEMVERFREEPRNVEMNRLLEENRQMREELGITKPFEQPTEIAPKEGYKTTKEIQENRAAQEMKDKSEQTPNELEEESEQEKIG